MPVHVVIDDATGRVKGGNDAAAKGGVFGDESGGDYAEFEDDGTLKFYGDSTAFRDEFGPLIGAKLESASKITSNAAEGTITFKDSATLSDYVSMPVQINNDAKAQSDVYPHIHWWQASANIPNWLIQYRWQQNGAAKTTSWTRDTVTDARAQGKAVNVPADAYLHFAPPYGFGFDGYGNYDGGVLEYSTNGGASWVDAGPLMDKNGYRGTIASGYSNTLANRSAFVGSSHGYISTRLNLASLAGRTVLFSWRMGLDYGGFAAGWWVDNIKLYFCGSPVLSGNAGAPGVVLSYTDGSAKEAVSGNDGSYSLSVSPSWSGTVTPAHPCYTFDPPSRTYAGVIASQAGQNFTALFNNAPMCGVTVGVFRPSNGLLYLKNANLTGYADVAINYGMGGDYPIAGDWDGDGVDTIGIYRNGVFYLRNSNTVGSADLYFAFGSPGDQPIAGDWDGDGKDTIGVYRSADITFYLRNSNDSGAPDASFRLGMPGDVGIAGDWDGDGRDTTGVFRPSNSSS